MRFSGFSFRLGKRTRLYFSNPKKSTAKASPARRAPAQQNNLAPRVTIGGIAWRLVLMFIACNWVSITYWRGDLLPFIIAVILAVGAAALLIWYLVSVRRAREAWGEAQKPQPAAEPETPSSPTPAEAWQAELDDMAKAEKLQAQLDAEAAARAPKYKTVQILLELDASPEHQQALKDLKLKIASEGLHANVDLQQNDDLITVAVDDFILGKVSTADALWIDRCFSYIDTIKGFEIIGGGRDAFSEPRPFMVKVALSVHSTAPGVPDTRNFDILPAVRIWGARSDMVCYVSSTGTVHHKLGSCSISPDWTPILLSDAADQGFKPCSRCFH